MSSPGPALYRARRVGRYGKEFTLYKFRSMVVSAGQRSPGITSMASLTYRNEERILSGEDWERVYVTQVMPAKLAIDLEYAQHATLWRDIALILRTVLVR